MEAKNAGRDYRVATAIMTQARLGFTGSNMTISSVQSGPKSREASHQFKPLRPLACANPAFISERVNQPTAYSLVLEIFAIEPLYASAREYSYYKTLAKLEGDTLPSCEITISDLGFLINRPTRQR